MNAARMTTIAVLAATLLAGAALAATPVALKTTELGQGPTLVLVHELGAGRMSWMPVVRKLIGRYHVVMVDLPGHGESAMPEEFTLKAAADALDLVLARQKPDSTVLVGHGVGGVIALFEASAHPERMKGLIILTAAAKSPMPIPDQQRQMFLKYIEEHYDDFVKMMFTAQGRDSAQAVAVHAQAALVAPVTMKAYLRELLVLDASAAVKSLKVPLLYIGGEKNWPADQGWPEMAKKFGYDEAPNVSWRRIGASGHYVAQDQPDSVAAAITDFAGRMLVPASAKK
jgi:pimeloyl-ACP methyl ester carboxylesterase